MTNQKLMRLDKAVKAFRTHGRNDFRAAVIRNGWNLRSYLERELAKTKR